ncbi:MAG TPA: alpha-L-rhamnosidase C-terminal domain-containing protein [Verrucomicrobiae bacterium]|nr:alpha-L-rhamnosidase C-terminal domain-containing protein [Verrucomicrobiae bacterium]
MKRGLLGLILAVLGFASLAQDKLPAGIPASIQTRVESSPLRSWFLAPTRIVWQSEQGVKNADRLLQKNPGQTVLKNVSPPCALTASTNQLAGVLLDFGVEIQGYVEIFTPMEGNRPPAPVRVRLGESVSEAMAETGEKNSQNDHAVRDQEDSLPWCGKKIVGPSGFRFVRIDAIDPKQPVSISEVRAVLQLRDVPYVGAFRCSDERLNRIWKVGACTVHLNMQEYLWDGIKRDRLVWLGDMHPEVSTINAVFGFNEVVPRSLDLIRDITPPTEWMNGISSYSMWWVLIQEDLWMHHGDRAYLEAQRDYLAKLLHHLATFVGTNGSEQLDGMRFLDWPTFENKAAVHEGLQAMLTMTMESGARLSAALGDEATAKRCRDAAANLRQHKPDSSGRKSPAALLALAGARPAKEVAEKVLKVNGPSDLSTFYGFYVLQALAKSGDADAALDFISAYWGGMLDYGATTFWEDFDLAWTNNAARIDELVPPGKKDIHGDYGAHCYIGFRHSLCHGWASGPTAWLSQHVLGVTPLEPGFKRVRVVPQLGRLRWAEGSYPTPLGPIKVRHERQADGSMKSDIQSPTGVIVERK